MKWLLNKHPENEEFEPGENWHLLEEDELNVQMIKALPVVIGMYLVTRFIFAQLGFDYEMELIYLVPASIIMIVIHELIHALCFPEKLKSDWVVFGAYPVRMMFYASYEGIMTVKQMKICLVMPLLVITLVGTIMLYVVPYDELICNIIFLNAIGSAFDIMSLKKLIKELPKGSKIRNKGMQTYWQ